MRCSKGENCREIHPKPDAVYSRLIKRLIKIRSVLIFSEIREQFHGCFGFALPCLVSEVG